VPKKKASILKKTAVYAVAVILTASVVLGAGLWLSNVEVPVQYDEPYSIRMSDEERDEEWQTISFKDTTTRPEDADFSISEPEYKYYTYVEIDNPRDDPVTIGVTISEPDGWDEDMSFEVYDGRLNVGEEGDPEEEGEGSVSYDIEDVGEETEWITVIYELGEDAPDDDGSYEVEWEFREGGTDGIWLADALAPITYDDDIAHVETLEAEVDDDNDEVTLNGVLEYLRGYAEVDLGFEYREAGTDNGWSRESSEDDANEPMEFDAELSFDGNGDLDPDTTYEYRASVEEDFDDDEFINKGGVLEFTTQEIEKEMEGDGEDGDPYQIENWNHLSLVRNEMDAYYELQNDLEFGDYAEDDWSPIGTQDVRFTGTFDGQGYTISDLEIDRPDENNVGLFGHVGRGATIENVCVKDAVVTGGRGVGTLIGRVTGDKTTLIEGTCSVGGSVEGTGAVGGLIGSFNSYRETGGGVDNPVLSQSFADVEVNDHDESSGNYDKFGGLVGCGQKGTVRNSYALGDVTVENEEGTRIGGLAGCIDLRGVVENTYSTGEVDGPEDEGTIGALVGNIEGIGGNAGEVIYSYSDRDLDLVGVEGDGDVTGGILDTDEMQGSEAEDNMDEFDFDTIWKTVEKNNDATEDGYPILQNLDRVRQLKAQGVYDND